MRRSKRRRVDVDLWGQAVEVQFKPSEPKLLDDIIREIETFAGRSLRPQERKQAERDIFFIAESYFQSTWDEDCWPPDTELRELLNIQIKAAQKCIDALGNAGHAEVTIINTGHAQLYHSLLAHLVKVVLNMMAVRDNGAKSHRGPQGAFAYFPLIVNCRLLLAKYSGGKAAGFTRGDGPLARLAKKIAKYSTGKIVNLDRRMKEVSRDWKLGGFTLGEGFVEPMCRLIPTS